MTSDPSSPELSPPAIDTSVSHSARIWNYWLGGKDNYQVDREVGDQIQQILPEVATLARASRACLGRIIAYLAGEAGIRQFLDIGTGLPTAGNTHEIAQSIAPESRIVYVDNDPLVLAHARALLTSTPEGACSYIHADLRDPGRILDAARGVLDFSQPVAVILMGILHHVVDDGEAQAVVDRLAEALPPGSYLAMSHATNYIDKASMDQVAEQWNASGEEPIKLRHPDQLGAFLAGLELVEPGVASVSRWRPDPIEVGSTPEVDEFAVVGRKP